MTVLLENIDFLSEDAWIQLTQEFHAQIMTFFTSKLSDDYNRDRYFFESGEVEANHPDTERKYTVTFNLRHTNPAFLAVSPHGMAAIISGSIVYDSVKRNITFHLCGEEIDKHGRPLVGGGRPMRTDGVQILLIPPTPIFFKNAMTDSYY